MGIRNVEIRVPHADQTATSEARHRARLELDEGHLAVVLHPEPIAEQTRRAPVDEVPQRETIRAELVHAAVVEERPAGRDARVPVVRLAPPFGRVGPTGEARARRARRAKRAERPLRRERLRGVGTVEGARDRGRCRCRGRRHGGCRRRAVRIAGRGWRRLSRAMAPERHHQRQRREGHRPCPPDGASERVHDACNHSAKSPRPMASTAQRRATKRR